MTIGYSKGAIVINNKYVLILIINKMRVKGKKIENVIK